MKNKILKHGPLINFLFIAALLAVIWIEVHWSVSVLCAWLSYTIGTFANGMGKLKYDYNKKIKAVRQDFQGIVAKAAKNTLDQLDQMPKGGFGRVQMPGAEMPKPNPNREPCPKCLADPKPGQVIYNKGNCPIHD